MTHTHKRPRKILGLIGGRLDTWLALKEGITKTYSKAEATSGGRAVVHR